MSTIETLIYHRPSLLRAMCAALSSVSQFRLVRCHTHPHVLKSRSQQGFPGSPEKSQREGQEDQTTLKALQGVPLATLYLALVLLGLLLALPWAPWKSLLGSSFKAEFVH